MRDLDFLAPGWRTRVGRQFDEPYLESLRAFLREEYRSGATVFPPKDRIFTALRLVDFDDAKIVVLGQDPYHGPGQAMGMSFAVPDGVQTPPSLRNIFKEISDDLGVPLPRHTDLSGWAQQGVLLLNTALTVEAGQAGSHQRRGWEEFTDAAVAAVAARKEPSVFVLWGAHARKKAAGVARLGAGSPHLVLASAHPSPLSAYAGFFGSKPFSKATAFLEANGRGVIDWRLP